jgi:hypothetical protein
MNIEVSISIPPYYASDNYEYYELLLFHNDNQFFQVLCLISIDDLVTYLKK